MNKDRKKELLEKYEHTGDEGAMEEALKLFAEAVEEQPDNAENLFFYGWLLESKGLSLLRKAASCFTKGLEVESNNSWINAKLNYQHIQVRAHLLENNKSVEFYKKKLAEFPDDPQMYCYLFHCYLHADQLHEANKVVEAGLKISPNHGPLNYCAGLVHSRQGDTKTAMERFERAILLDPELIDARFSRAFLLEKEEQLEEAIREWQAITEWLRSRGFLDEGPKTKLKEMQEKLQTPK